MSKSKDIGTKAEIAVARAAQVRGFPRADRHILKGSKDEGDVWLTQTGSLVVEVKGGEMARAASHERVTGWLEETERERVHAGAHLAFLVVQRRGVGEANAHRWWAYFTGEMLDRLLLPARVNLDGLVFRVEYHEALAMLVSAGFGPEGQVPQLEEDYGIPVAMTAEDEAMPRGGR